MCTQQLFLELLTFLSVLHSELCTSNQHVQTAIAARDELELKWVEFGEGRVVVAAEECIHILDYNRFVITGCEAHSSGGPGDPGAHQAAGLSPGKSLDGAAGESGAELKPLNLLKWLFISDQSKTVPADGF